MRSSRVQLGTRVQLAAAHFGVAVREAQKSRALLAHTPLYEHTIGRRGGIHPAGLIDGSYKLGTSQGFWVGRGVSRTWRQGQYEASAEQQY